MGIEALIDKLEPHTQGHWFLWHIHEAPRVRSDPMAYCLNWCYWPGKTRLSGPGHDLVRVWKFQWRIHLPLFAPSTWGEEKKISIKENIVNELYICFRCVDLVPNQRWVTRFNWISLKQWWKYYCHIVRNSWCSRHYAEAQVSVFR